MHILFTQNERRGVNQEMERFLSPNKKCCFFLLISAQKLISVSSFSVQLLLRSLRVSTEQKQTGSGTAVAPRIEKIAGAASKYIDLNGSSKSRERSNESTCPNPFYLVRRLRAALNRLFPLAES